MNLTEYVDKFDGKKILVIGDVMLDEYLWGRVERISPEAPVPLVEIERESTGPGGAANVANNIKSMGGIPILVGITGRDEAGDILRRDLIKLGIDTDGLILINDRPTIRKTRIIATDQQLVRLDREKRHKIDSQTKETIIESIKSRLKNVDAVLLEDYDKGLFDRQLIEKIIGLCKEDIITVDPKFENLLYYRGVTAIKPNRRELEYAVGIKLTPQNIEEAVGKIMGILKCEYIVLTLGREGMFVKEKEETYNISHRAMAEVHDTSGAGDTVIAALTLSLSSGADIYESALIASYAAGIEVGKVGVVPVRKGEILSAVEWWSSV